MLYTLKGALPTEKARPQSPNTGAVMHVQYIRVERERASRSRLTGKTLRFR